MSLRSPGVLDVVDKALTARLRNTHVALPARIEGYDAATQKARVLPLVKGWKRAPDGTRSAVQLPVISAVPVVFPGAGGFRLTFPVEVGDSVLLVFSDYSLDRWLKEGGAVDPIDERTHNLSDAICIPGLRDFGHPLTSAPTDGASLGADGGPTIHFTESAVKLGGSDATQGVILPTPFFGALSTYVQAIVAAMALPVGQAAAITAADNALSAASSGFLSSIVKVK